MAMLSRLLPTAMDGTCAEIGHTWCQSCVRSCVEIAWGVLVESFTRVYGPLYAISFLLRRKFQLSVVLKTLLECLRSSVFLSCQGGGFIGCFCVESRLFSGQWYFFTAFVAAFVSGFLSNLLERKKRRGMLALYIMNLAFETLYNRLVFRKVIKPVPFGEVALFSAAVAGLMCLQKGNEKDDAIRTGLRFLLWENKLARGVTSTHPPRGHVSQFLQVLRVQWDRLMAPIEEVLPPHFLSSRLLHSFQVGCRGFAMGWCVQAALGLLSALPQATKHPGKLLKAVTSRSNVTFGSFLGSLLGGYKAAMALLEYVRGADDRWNAFLAGGLAGVSMGFAPRPAIALYLAVKVFELYYFKLVSGGYLPKFYFGDALIYALGLGYLFHSVVMEPHNIRPSYWKFLLLVTRNRFAEMNRFLLDRQGTEASFMFRPKPLEDFMEEL